MPRVANSSRQLYQAFIKRGMGKEDAFFAVLDHFNGLHWHDRDRYDERIKALEAENARLKAVAGQPAP